ncbi:MAG: Maf family protein [Burkholderiaceae bacterium]
MSRRLILASQSPRRKQLLEQLAPSLDFELSVLKPSMEEDAESLEIPLPNENPSAYVERVTKAKLHAGLRRAQAHGLEGVPVLASDTTVAFNNEIFGKPVNAADAQRMLLQLSGQTHEVLTAVAVARTPNERPLCCLSRSEVWFAPLSEAWIQWVISTQEPMDKAGAYAIQGHAGAQIEWVRGSPSGIMGLPLFETQTLLQQIL